MSSELKKVKSQPESEKITINLGFVDLANIDLLARDGIYANRTGFIRTAIRNQLEPHSEPAKASISRKQLELGISYYSKAQLEQVRSCGEMLDIGVLGLATIGADVTPELARATIRSMVVLGALHASAAVKSALSDRIS